ncbi:hypothetical protein [Paraburkholderia xenovorans]|uniref:hypothetical protein n=1 Tax=Paraburkholderia xenovorans TaxID=36873 RepID=UPI0038B9884F
MTSTQPGVSPLRQRMTDDMRMRQLSPRTQAGYLRIVREFARYLKRFLRLRIVRPLRNQRQNSHSVGREADEGYRFPSTGVSRTACNGSPSADRFEARAFRRGCLATTRTICFQITNMSSERQDRVNDG